MYLFFKPYFCIFSVSSFFAQVVNFTGQTAQGFVGIAKNAVKTGAGGLVETVEGTAESLFTTVKNVTASLTG